MTSAFLHKNSMAEMKPSKGLILTSVPLFPKNIFGSSNSLSKQPAPAPLSSQNLAEQDKPGRKLFLIDWDDTLNPSSWCMHYGILTIRPPRKDEVNAVAGLSAKVLKTLTYCMEHGNVVIVTNAESGWVEKSARFLMPDVFQLLKKIPVVSARSSFENDFRDSPITWKSMAFARIIAEWAEDESKLGHSFSIPGQVVSIGDSAHEREALFRVHADHSVKFSPKSLKFMDSPTITDLERQHEVLHSNFTSILNDKAGGDLRYQHGLFAVFSAPLANRRPQSIPAPMKQRRTLNAFPASKLIRVGGFQKSPFSRGN